MAEFELIRFVTDDFLFVHNVTWLRNSLNKYAPNGSSIRSLQPPLHKLRPVQHKFNTQDVNNIQNANEHPSKLTPYAEEITVNQALAITTKETVLEVNAKKTK
jgi:hypothetical protein